MDSLKLKVDSTSDKFIYQLSKTSNDLADSMVQIREQNSRMSQVLDKKTSDFETVENHTNMLLQRMKKAELEVQQLKKDTIKLETQKLDESLFISTIGPVQKQLVEHESRVSNNLNHCETIDSYLDKYQPIRTQFLIQETLEAVLSSKDKRKLEVYSSEKFQILYNGILHGDNYDSTQRLITQLNERAQKEFAEEEKRRKRRMAGGNGSNAQSAS